eukprot:Clim_evm1s117 gene=Clim_evmTU1s117
MRLVSGTVSIGAAVVALMASSTTAHSCDDDAVNLGTDEQCSSASEGDRPYALEGRFCFPNVGGNCLQNCCTNVPKCRHVFTDEICREETGGQKPFSKNSEVDCIDGSCSVTQCCRAADTCDSLNDFLEGALCPDTEVFLGGKTCKDTSGNPRDCYAEDCCRQPATCTTLQLTDNLKCTQAASSGDVGEYIGGDGVCEGDCEPSDCCLFYPEPKVTCADINAGNTEECQSRAGTGKIATFIGPVEGECTEIDVGGVDCTLDKCCSIVDAATCQSLERGSDDECASFAPFVGDKAVYTGTSGCSDGGGTPIDCVPDDCCSYYRTCSTAGFDNDGACSEVAPTGESGFYNGVTDCLVDGVNADCTEYECCDFHVTCVDINAGNTAQCQALADPGYIALFIGPATGACDGEDCTEDTCCSFSLAATCESLERGSDDECASFAPFVGDNAVYTGASGCSDGGGTPIDCVPDDCCSYYRTCSTAGFDNDGACSEVAPTGESGFYNGVTDCLVDGVNADCTEYECCDFHVTCVDLNAGNTAQCQTQASDNKAGIFINENQGICEDTGVVVNCQLQDCCRFEETCQSLGLDSDAACAPVGEPGQTATYSGRNNCIGDGDAGGDSCTEEDCCEFTHTCSSLGLTSPGECAGKGPNAADTAVYTGTNVCTGDSEEELVDCELSDCCTYFQSCQSAGFGTDGLCDAVSGDEQTGFYSGVTDCFGDDNVNTNCTPDQCCNFRATCADINA